MKVTMRVTIPVMKPFTTWWKPFAGLAFCLLYPSTALFKKVGYSFMAFYCLAALLLLWLAIARLVPLARPFITPRRSAVFLLLIMAAILGAYLFIHPMIDTAGFHLAGKSFGSSDGDDAIDVALTEFLGGKYPYYAKTFLGSPITPMPGALLMAFPFYCVGDSAVQNVFWLGIFFVAVAVYYRSLPVAGIVACLLFFLSPNVLYHVLQGGDYITNSIYLATFSALLLETARRRAPCWQSVLWAMLLGVGLSSRLNFILILPAIFFALVKATSRRTACVLSAIVLVCYGAVTLPFYAYDPQGFSPLHTSNKLSLTGSFGWAPIVIPLFGGILTLGLASRRNAPELPVFMRDVFLVQAFMIVAACVLASISSKSLNLEYPHFGVLFMFFGVFAFGPACLIESGALPIRPGKDCHHAESI